MITTKKTSGCIYPNERAVYLDDTHIGWIRKGQTGYSGTTTGSRSVTAPNGDFTRDEALQDLVTTWREEQQIARAMDPERTGADYGD